MKKLFVLLSAALLAGGFAKAQKTVKCATDEVYRDAAARNPKIAEYQAALDNEIANYLKNRHTANAMAKGAGYANDTAEIYIPVVVHIIHNYGLEYISDNQAFTFVSRLNVYYNKRNADTANVIPTFKPYIGNAHITFALATIDPQGNRTHGITRNYSYQTNGGDESAKVGSWSPDSYLNIWLESYIGRGVTGGIVLAYATPPASGAADPAGDGVIARADATGTGSALDNTIEHEIGHYFNLQHPWGNGAIETDCGDDGVDDTPPTRGHFSTCNLYDTACASRPIIPQLPGYGKLYDSVSFFNLFGYNASAAHPLLVDYPDTANTQNIMDYSSCTNMFTKGQVVRMRTSLRSTIAGRANLTSAANLALTGTLLPRPDLAPIADFNVTQQIACVNTASSALTFLNRSWNDTVSSAAWTFSNGANNPTATGLTSVTGETFSQPGWVTVSLTATSNAGNNTITKSNVLYVADANTVNPAGYVQDFNDAADYGRWPIFNYYSSPYKWEVINTTGFYDHTSIRFNNFDTRINANNPAEVTQNPRGNYADYFSEPFDLTSVSSNVNAKLSFRSAGVYRTTNPVEMNDTLLVSYSTTCGATWTSLGTLTKGKLGNNGYYNSPYEPLSMGEWAANGFTLPASAKTARTFFRFRYKNGGDNTVGGYGYVYNSGNNFYMDRIEVTTNTLGVDAVTLNDKGIVLAPNPTSGSTMLTIKGGDNSMATIRVTDITGKTLYNTEARLTNAATQVEIPAERIAVKGMYLVEVVTNGRVMTQKLVVY